MSKYCWEAGTIKLSTAEFPKVRKAIWEAANADRAARLARAMELWTLLKAGHVERAAVTRTERDEELVDALFPPIEKDGRREMRTVPLMPRKKDFAPLPWKTLAFRDGWGECGVTFDPKTRTVRWRVSENNHAVERAREGWLGRAFFAALSRVNWTRGTGGTIVGNDEYNSDSEYEGGGANYVTASYPPPKPLAPRYGFTTTSNYSFNAPPRRWY
jgi:hypothetical protein